MVPAAWGEGLVKLVRGEKRSKTVSGVAPWESGGNGSVSYGQGSEGGFQTWQQRVDSNGQASTSSGSYSHGNGNGNGRPPAKQQQQAMPESDKRMLAKAMHAVKAAEPPITKPRPVFKPLSQEVCHVCFFLSQAWPVALKFVISYAVAPRYRRVWGWSWCAVVSSLHGACTVVSAASSQL